MLEIHIILFLFGLILLVKGADYFVKSSSSIAESYGVSEFIIGLTVVAIGTSIPELASSVTASLQMASGIVIGNIVGSNIANIGLIIGVSASITAIKTDKEILGRDGYIMLFSSFLFLFFIINGIISRIESIVFLLFYLVYILFLFRKKPKSEESYHFKEFIKFFVKFEYLNEIKNKIISDKKGRKKAPEEFKKGRLKDFIILAIALVAIIFGAKYLVEESIYFAQYLKLPDTMIGITLVAIGTSLPEFTVTISAAKQGHKNIAIGNIVGSNISNIFLILGISGTISSITVTKSTLYITAPFLILLSILLLTFVETDWEIKRKEGIALVTIYLAFMVMLFYLS